MRCSRPFLAPSPYERASHSFTLSPPCILIFSVFHWCCTFWDAAYSSSFHCNNGCPITLFLCLTPNSAINLMAGLSAKPQQQRTSTVDNPPDHHILSFFSSCAYEIFSFQGSANVISSDKKSWQSFTLSISLFTLLYCTILKHFQDLIMPTI